jgi:hypothetical protein
MHDLMVRAAQRGYRESLSVPRGAYAEYDHAAIARHVSQAKAMRAAELARLWTVLARRAARWRDFVAGRGGRVKLPQPVRS